MSKIKNKPPKIKISKSTAIKYKLHKRVIAMTKKIKQLTIDRDKLLEEISKIKFER